MHLCVKWTLAGLEMLHLIIRTLKLPRWRFTCKRMPQPTEPNSQGIANHSFIYTHSSSVFRLTNPLCRARRALGGISSSFFALSYLKVRLSRAFSRPAELLRPPTCTKFLSLGSFHCSYPGCRRQLRGQRPPIHRAQRYAAAPAGDFLLPDIPQTMTLTRLTALRAAWIGGNCRTIQSIFILIKLNNVLFHCVSDERAWACSKYPVWNTWSFHPLF